MRAKSINLLLILMTLFIVQSLGYKELHDIHQIMAYYQEKSSKPLLHVYYNRHFKNSTQFKQFQRTLGQVYDDHGDYMDILYTNCDQDLQLRISNCKIMNRTKDNRQITGTVPSSKFRKIGEKLIQNPPSTQVLDHKRDVYSYTQIRDFVLSLQPNFYQEINNLEQYEDFLLPKYSPKLIAFVTQDEPFPLVLKQIGVKFFLHFDFGFITDLSSEPLSAFDIKEFPSLAIVKYNFNQSKYQTIYYTKGEINQNNYQSIKKFVSSYALPEPRNDLLFHKIVMDTRSQILTAENEGELQQLKERASGWAIIVKSDGKIPQKLIDISQKYGNYYSYINYVSEPVGSIELYSPSQNRVYPFAGQDLQFNTLNFEDFKGNMTVWLTKDMIILGVSEDYGYVCGLAEKTMFRDFVRCLIIQNQYKKQLQEFMKIQIKIGFIASTSKTQASTTQQITRQTKGIKIEVDNFQTIYRDVDYAVRGKLKQMLEQYLQKPLSEPKEGLKVSQSCSHPFKKCIFLVTNLGKPDRTFQQYLKQIAFDYMNSFIIYQLDIDANPQFVKAIGGIKDKKVDLVVFNPRSQEFIKLNKKVSKNLISQFMKANLKNDKRLKKQKNQDFDQIVLHRRVKKEEKKKQEEQFQAQQL